MSEAIEAVNDRLARLHRRLFISKDTLNERMIRKYKLWLWGIEQLQKESSSSDEILAAAGHWESELDAELGTRSAQRMMGTSATNGATNG